MTPTPSAVSAGSSPASPRPGPAGRQCVGRPRIHLVADAAPPLEAAHVLGKLLLAVGEDRILWGTDSVW